MHLFDTAVDDRIVEHWDVIAPWRDDSVSGRSMLDGPAEPSGPQANEENKALVRRFLVEVFQNGHHDRLDEFVAEIWLNTTRSWQMGAEPCGAGLRGLKANGTRFAYDFVFKVIGQADVVVSYSKMLRGDRELAVFDVWRVAAGRIVEHWNNVEAIGPRDAWGISGKF